jgi:hypothetical protein
MKSKDVFKLYGNKSRVAVALGLTRAASSWWGEEVPLLRQYQLRERRPTIDAEIAAMKDSSRPE